MGQKYYSVGHKQYIDINKYGYHALTNDEIDAVKIEELSRRLQRIDQRLEQLLENIDAMEKILSEMKERYKKEKEQEYRASAHKSFKVGDWVQKGKEFGKVGWVKNDGLCIKEEDGYVGIDLYSGTRGFKVCRRDDWDIMSDKDVEYLTNVHEIRLTGEGICELYYRLRYSNWSKVGEEVRKKIKLVGDFSLFKKKGE